MTGKFELSSGQLCTHLVQCFHYYSLEIASLRCGNAFHPMFAGICVGEFPARFHGKAGGMGDEDTMIYSNSRQQARKCHDDIEKNIEAAYSG